MEIRIKKNPNSIGLLSKLTYLLLGILTATLVLAAFTKLPTTYGIALGLLVNLAATYLGFTYSTSKTRTRIMVWGLLLMTVFSTLFAAAFYMTLLKL